MHKQIHIHMQEQLMKKDDMNLKESWEGYIGKVWGWKGKGEMFKLT